VKLSPLTPAVFISRPNRFLAIVAVDGRQTLAHVLKQCGNDLSRANVMRQAANIKTLELPMFLPGIKINTSPTDFYPIEQEQLARFDGERWVLFGNPLPTLRCPATFEAWRDPSTWEVLKPQSSVPAMLPTVERAYRQPATEPTLSRLCAASLMV